MTDDARGSLIAARLREEADTSEKGLAFMGDPELIDETRAQIAMLREAANEIEAQGLEIRAYKLVDYGNSLPDGVTTEAFAEAELLRREARRGVSVADGLRSSPRNPQTCEHENIRRLRPLYFEGHPLYVCDDCGSELIDETGEWSRKALVEVKRNA